MRLTVNPDTLKGQQTVHSYYSHSQFSSILHVAILYCTKKKNNHTSEENVHFQTSMVPTLSIPVKLQSMIAVTRYYSKVLPVKTVFNKRCEHLRSFQCLVLNARAFVILAMKYTVSLNIFNGFKIALCLSFLYALSTSIVSRLDQNSENSEVRNAIGYCSFDP